jgi:hypothetical protein
MASLLRDLESLNGRPRRAADGILSVGRLRRARPPRPGYSSTLSCKVRIGLLRSFVELTGSPAAWTPPRAYGVQLRSGGLLVWRSPLTESWGRYRSRIRVNSQVSTMPELSGRWTRPPVRNSLEGAGSFDPANGSSPGSVRQAAGRTVTLDPF